MFSKLLRNPKHLEPCVVQDLARNLLPKLLAESNLAERLPDSPIDDKRRHVVLGIASYSNHDLKLLDELNESYDKWKYTIKLEVFDVANCTSMDSIQDYIPGAGIIRATPIMKCWDRGQPLEIARGLDQVATLRELIKL